MKREKIKINYFKFSVKKFLTLNKISKFNLCLNKNKIGILSLSSMIVLAHGHK